MKKFDAIARLREAEKYFTTDEYRPTVVKAGRLFMSGKLDECLKVLNTLPTADDLFEKIVEKLKGKSVYKTLRSIQEGKRDNLTKATGISSLITHILIEVKAGRPEYGILVKKLLEQLSRLVYEM